MTALDDQARLLFLAALERDPELWPAFLDEACGDNAELRTRVGQLLHAHQAIGSIHGIKAGELTATMGNPAANLAGTIVAGRYKLLEAIGEGGMGEVWVADQLEPIRRRVALKLIKPGMDSRSVLARFEAERQALALMDHPNIAKVLDAGTTDDGRPYFVMELVKGTPITKFCDERKLSPRQRLELFIPVCQAIQHAHQKGIIHRDIKPTNVLVALHDEKPVPKVIDFGVAKAIGQQLTEKTLYTGFGALIGTPAYMAPEQATFNQLDVDTRADVYALGVLLYELLAGSPPFEPERLKNAALDEVLRLVREEEPPRPSQRLSTSEAKASIAAVRQSEPARLARLLRGELDWIVMKALEKDRNRRYETANGFAADVQHYLADESVLACPPSAGYRLRKFARKNRNFIGMATSIVLLLAAGTGVSIWQALRAREAAKDSLKARDREADQAKEAEKSEARARAVLKFFQDKVLAAPRPKGQEGGVHRDVTIREALDEAEPEIAKAFVDQPLVEASIRNTLGVSYWYLGALDLAQRQHERALALRRQELGPDHPDTIGILNDLGLILHSQGKYPEAQKLFAQAWEGKRRTLGPEDPITLRSANNLSAIMAEQGLFEEALLLAEETWEIRKRVEEPNSVFTLRSAYNVAIMRRHVGQAAEARTLFEQTLKTLESAPFGPDHQDTLRVMDYLGELLLEQGQAQKAEELFVKTLNVQRRVLGGISDETILTLANLADALRAQGRLDEACKFAEEADELHRRTLGADHPQTLAARTILADVYRDQGRFAEAGKVYEQSLASLRRILSPKTPEVKRAMNGYAWMLATTSDPRFRDPHRAVKLAKEVVEHAPKFGDKWTTLGVASHRAGDWKNAIIALEKSETLAPGRFSAINDFFLAMAHWKLGEKDKAREWYDRAVLWMDKNQPNNEELRRFRAEAAQLLERKEKK